MYNTVPLRDTSSSGVVLEEQFMAANEICRQPSTLSINLKLHLIKTQLRLVLNLNTFGNGIASAVLLGL